MKYNLKLYEYALYSTLQFYLLIYEVLCNHKRIESRKQKT